MKKYLFCLLAAGFLSLVSLYAGEPEITYSELSWEDCLLTFDITALLPDRSVLPSSRFQTEQEIIDSAPALLAEVCGSIPIDSWYTVNEKILESPEIYRKLESLFPYLKKSFSVVSDNKKDLTVRYSLSLFPYLAELFFIHQQPRKLPGSIGFESSEEFSGIVILADHPLPEKGTDNIVLLTPCLFPRLYDENMTPLLDIESTDPEYLKKWGTAGYTSLYDLSVFEDRIGNYPLRISAQAVFGKNKTDLIISRKDARKILSLEENKKLLKEGRVIIIYKP